nr:Chain L, Kallidin [Homo sapiens]prf//610207A kallidin II [Homo sapiens]
KRPPGFSPFR